MLPTYFDYIFVYLRQKVPSPVRIKPETFVNFMPEPDPKSPARLTTLGRTDVEDDERSQTPNRTKIH